MFTVITNHKPASVRSQAGVVLKSAARIAVNARKHIKRFVYVQREDIANFFSNLSNNRQEVSLSF